MAGVTSLCHETEHLEWSYATFVGFLGHAMKKECVSGMLNGSVLFSARIFD